MTRLFGMGAWRWLGPFVLLLAWTVESRGAEVCIGPEARATVQCDEQARVALGAHQPLAFGVPRPMPPAKPRPLANPPSSRALGFLEAPNPRLRRHARRLLVTEIAQVTALLRATPVESPDHARLQRRLAESYVELGDRLANHRANTPQEKARLAQRVAKARRLAIQYYRQLHQAHPRYCRFPRARREARSCDDEVLFFWGYELEKAGYPEHARQTYGKLLQRWPGSPHAELARLAFAELTFDAAQRDANLWPEARKAYEGAVLRFPRGSARWAYAQYKLGYVHWHRARYPEALAAFKATLEHAAVSHETAPLLAAARRDVIPVFAEAGDPAQAWTTFAAFSGSKDDTRAMVEDLGRKLLDTGRFDDAATLYQSLALRPAPAGARCRYQVALVETTIAQDPLDKTAIEAGLKKAVQRLEAASDDDTCGAHVASLVATTAIAWHVEVAGNPAGAKPVLGTGDAATADAALRLYRLFTSTFTDEMLARYRFPRLRTEDRPTLARMHYAHADLLWARADWSACGPVFESARAANPSGPLAARAIQASALCHLRRGIDTSAPGDVRSKGALSASAATTIDALSRYACRVAPIGPEATKAADQMRFARASLRASAGHYEAAALDFRELALSETAATELSQRAASRYLAVLEALRKREARSSCVADARRALPQLRQRHCRTDAAICGHFTETERDLGRREAEALLDRGDRGGPAQTEAYRRGASLYLRLWREHGEAACRADAKQCDGYARMLHESARGFASAHELARAMEVRELLVDPENALHTTAAGIVARRDLAHDHRALGQLGQAAEHYARYASDNPRRPDAALALAEAIALQARSGDPKLAARTFARRFAHAEPRLALEVALDLAQRQDRLGRHQKALKIISQAQKSFERSGLVALDLVVRTEALLGRLHHRLGAADEANQHFGRARDARSQRPALRRAVAQAAADEKGPWRRKVQRFSLAIDAIGRALEHFAVRERNRIAALGEGSDAAWLRRRMQATKRAVEAYGPLLELGAPRTTVLAGLAIAELHGQLLADAEAVPGADVAAHRRRAKTAYEGCLELGVVHQRFGSPLRQCEAWLSEHYPLEYHQRDEIEAPSQLVASP